MKALVLAAGQGVRMGPLTENRPKPMLPVAGRPFLEHTIIALKDAGIEEIFILTGIVPSGVNYSSVDSQPVRLLRAPVLWVTHPDSGLVEVSEKCTKPRKRLNIAVFACWRGFPWPCDTW